MNLTNRKIILAIVILTFQINNAKNYNTPKDHCEEKNVTIKTEVKSRYKYFFFRRTNHKKVKRIDKVVNQNGKVIKKIVMRSAETNDYCWYRKFHRIVIIGEELHEVILLEKEEKGKLIIYNYCGEKISEQILSADELYYKYGFSMI